MSKKILIPCIVTLMLLSGKQLRAQDCRAIVLPMFRYNEESYQAVPEDKLAIHCAYSCNMFYMTDTWPKDAPIYSISEVKEYRSGNFLSKNIKIDLDTFSYYAYDFIAFQARHSNEEIYFETPGSEHKYLVLRTPNEALDRTEFPERFNKEK